MKRDIRFCTAHDGAKLAYAVSGDGPALVLNSAWLTHLGPLWRDLAWQPWLETFSKDCKLLRYDARGCGLSDREPQDLSFEAWVRDFESVVDAAGFGQFSILATRQHGAVAIAYAARHPERVRKLVLFGTFAIRGMLGMLRHDLPADIEKARVVPPLRLGREPDNDALLRICTHAFQAVRMLEIDWNVDLRAAARNLKCPVLIMHPKRDAAVPAVSGRSLVGLIPGSRFVEIDSDNHMPLADEPAWPRVVSEVRGFLGESAPALAAGGHALALDDLTPRERAVLEGIATGLDNTELAASLGIAEKTVRNHITRVFDKISVKHRYDAIVRARAAGLGAADADTLTRVR